MHREIGRRAKGCNAVSKDLRIDVLFHWSYGRFSLKKLRDVWFVNRDASGSATFYFLNALTRFLCKNLCKKVLPILFFYWIKVRGHAHYANARINFNTTHEGLLFKIDSSLTIFKTGFSMVRNCYFLWIISKYAIFSCRRLFRTVLYDFFSQAVLPL